MFFSLAFVFVAMQIGFLNTLISDAGYVAGEIYGAIFVILFMLCTAVFVAGRGK